MKFSIEHDALLKALSQAQSVVERRNTIPILANVLIEAEANQVSFRTTDMDIGVIDLTTAQVENTGATTVSAIMLHDIVRKMPEGALLTLSDDGTSGRMTISAGKSNFELTTLPKEDFPPLPTSSYEASFSASTQVLRRLFDKSKFAMSTEETRYYLNGVYMHIADGDDGQVLRCVATDGHRLAQIETPVPEGAENMPGVIVPRKTVGELLKLLSNDDVDIAVSVSETNVRFATPDVTLTSKVIDGTFPEYAKVIPISNERKMEVDASEFSKAVDRVSTISLERSSAVKMTIEADCLTLTVNSHESGMAKEELTVAYADEQIEIGFNAKYLQEIASQVDRENAVFLFNTSAEPALVREGNDRSAIYVVMPMRV